MDTNKENELMQNLAKQTPPATDGHLADGRPARPGVSWAAVNPPAAQPAQPSGASSQASQPSMDGFGSLEELSDIEKVTPEMVNRMEAYGTEAVYDASKNH